MYKWKVTYVCGDALPSLWDFGEGIIDGRDVCDDGLLIWTWNIHIWWEREMETVRETSGLYVIISRTHVSSIRVTFPCCEEPRREIF